MKKNNHNILIDYMNIGQLNDVMEVERLCFTIPWSENSFISDLTENENAVYFSALTSGRVVGYIGMWVIFDEAHIMNVAVHPEFRRMGIGSVLINKIIETSRLLNLKSMTLEVKKSNYAAIDLYRCFGFIEAGVRKGYYEDTNEDAIIMWKTL
jgi:[ribosomal protein S18]-alanine N-acetyltransferase